MTSESVGKGQYQGFSSELRTPQELLAKLEYDLGRMEKDRSDSYAAFDFFVTAEHMGEWCDDKTYAHKNDHGGDMWLLAACDIANNAKHYMRHRMETALQDVVVSPGAFSDAFSDAFQKDELYVLLDDDSDMPVVQLARGVLKLWQQELRRVE